MTIPEELWLALATTLVIMFLGWICGVLGQEEPCAMCKGSGQSWIDDEALATGGRLGNCQTCSGTGHRSGE